MSKQRDASPTRSPVPVDKNGIKLEFGDMLMCPCCYESDIHQDKVVVEWRNEEDGDGKRITSGDERSPTIEHIKSKGLANRRHNIYIRLWCEHCETRSYLQIVQHKGKTIMRWGQKGRSLSANYSS